MHESGSRQSFEGTSTRILCGEVDIFESKGGNTRSMHDLMNGMKALNSTIWAQQQNTHVSVGSWTDNIVEVTTVVLSNPMETLLF